MKASRTEAGEGPVESISDPGEARFLVFNATDGVMASPELMTLAEARHFIEQFPARFAHQGYYLTASRQRIRPDAVALEIMDTGACPGPDGESASESHGGGENE